jgi:hypothetical protein
MAGAAWAFVRPFEIDRGIQAAVAAKASEDANAIALASAQDALDYNRVSRGLSNQVVQQGLDYNNQMRPLQVQQIQNSLDFNKQLQPLQVQQAQQASQLGTNKFVDAQSAFAVDQLFKSVPLTAGESEEDTYKKYLAAATSATDPVIKNAAAQRLNSMAPQLAIQALNKGDSTSAHNILLASNNGPLPTFQAFQDSTPAQKYAVASNPAVALDNAKTANEIKLRQVPSGDTVVKETFNQSDRLNLSQQDMAKGYTQLLIESQKTGIPMTMTFQQYMAMFAQSKAPTSGNSVTGSSTKGPVTPGVSPTGVPYK